MKKTINNCLHKHEYATPQMKVYNLANHQSLMAGSFGESLPEEETNNIEFD
ncbi:MAG: hypothetical protein IJ552_03980 [Prevotella sp.]|nr:hypothetical protein [Prevotella sp.]